MMVLGCMLTPWLLAEHSTALLMVQTGLESLLCCSHHNDSGEDAWVLPVQDAGLYTYQRTLNIR